VAAVSTLDRVTGLQAARDRAESAAAQAGPRGLQHGTLQQGALIESREAGSVPRKMAMLRWAPFALGVVGLVGMAAWQGGSEGVQRLGHDLIAPFTGASPSVVQAHSAPKASAPAEAVARVADPAAVEAAPVVEAGPVAEATPAVEVGPGGGTLADRASVADPVAPAASAPVAAPDAAGPPRGLAQMIPLGGMVPSLAMVGLMLLLAFAASYAQRWYTHRHALPADDPWERLDERLRLRRLG